MASLRTTSNEVLVNTNRCLQKRDLVVIGLENIIDGIVDVLLLLCLVGV